MDDQTTPSEPVEDTEATQSAPEPVSPVADPVPLEPNDSEPADTPPIAPESPINADNPVPAEDQNEGQNQPESEVPEPVSDVPQESVDVQPSSPTLINESQASEPIQTASVQAQNVPPQDQGGFIRSLLVKAQAKIHSNKQKKLDKVIQLAQKKGFISNKETQIFLHVSAATATRYLSRLVKEGRLSCSGQARDLRYHFVR